MITTFELHINARLNIIYKRYKKVEKIKKDCCLI